MLEIENQRESCKATSVRASSPELEEIMYFPIKLLDHGFIRVIDYMGNDSSIVQAARVSYGAGTKQTNEDRGLINYLMRHSHTTPFEMCELKLHIKMPIFVARQWLRHRTASVNEYSARYSILNREFYIPNGDQLTCQSVSNKQGKSDVIIDSCDEILSLMEETCENAYNSYKYMMEEKGLTRELARTVLPVSCYTELYWKIDLHNLLHFLRLRADSHAQYEIRCYAEAILDIVKKWVPMTHEAFINYRVNSETFSADQLKALKAMLSGEKTSQENSGLSKGEWAEFSEKIAKI